MARVNSKAEFDVADAENVLGVIENLSRDLNNIEDRQERLNELGIELQLKNDSGEIVVELQDT